MENKNIDQFFKNKADNSSFDFDESYWSEMEALIEKDNDQPIIIPFWKKRKGTITLTLLFLLASTIIGLLIGRSNSNSIKSPLNLSSENIPIKGKTIIKNDAPITKNTEKAGVIPVTTNKKGKENQPIITNPSTNNEATNNKKHGIQPKKESAKVNSNREGTSLKSSQGTQRPNQPNINPKLKSVHPNFPNISIKDVNAKVDQENSKDDEKDPKPIIPIADNPTLKKVDDIAFLYTLPLVDVDLLPKNIDDAPLFPTKEESEDEENIIKPKLNLIYGAIAGGNFYSGFLNMGEKREIIANDFFGGIYMKIPIVENKWMAQVGVNYWQRGALNSEIQLDSIVYGFGLTTHSKKINIHHLQYIQIPIHLIRSFEQSQVLIGMSASYLLNAKGTMQKTVVSDFEINDEGIINQNGYQSAYNRLDITLNLGYEYSIYKNLNAGIAAQIGLMDISKNEIFQNNVYDNNLQCRVYLSYDLK